MGCTDKLLIANPESIQGLAMWADLLARFYYLWTLEKYWNDIWGSP